MIVDKIQPRVITYRLKAETNDEGWQCMWAKFIFDCDSGQLNINSDAGDYSYRWGYNENEDFMHLMSRINKDYLLNKISDRSKFNFEASQKEMIKAVKKDAIPYGWCKNGKEVSELVNQIKNIEYRCSEEYFFREIYDMISEIDFESIEIIKEYPCGANVVADLFEKYIQPKIKSDLTSTN